jgi:hypothetical protein
VGGNSIAAKKPNTQVSFKAEASAKIAAAPITIIGKAEIDGRTVTHPVVLPTPRGEPAVDSLLLAVAIPTPFQVTGVYNSTYASRGSVFRKRYSIERNGYDGPLTVSLADRQARHLQGVTGPTITVPAGATEFDYPIHLPPWLEIGRTSRTTVMAVAEVVDADGTKHKVSHSSTNQNEQLVVLTDPGRLNLTAGRSSMLVQPGDAASLEVRVERAIGIASAVKVELACPAHVGGVSAEAIEIPAGQSSGMLMLRFAASQLGPFNMPLVLRATAIDEHGDPVVAECQVELAGP